MEHPPAIPPNHYHEYVGLPMTEVSRVQDVTTTGSITMTTRTTTTTTRTTVVKQPVDEPNVLPLKDTLVITENIIRSRPGSNALTESERLLDGSYDIINGGREEQVCVVTSEEPVTSTHGIRQTQTRVITTKYRTTVEGDDRPEVTEYTESDEYLMPQTADHGGSTPTPTKDTAESTRETITHVTPFRNSYLDEQTSVEVHREKEDTPSSGADTVVEVDRTIYIDSGLEGQKRVLFVASVESTSAGTTVSVPSPTGDRRHVEESVTDVQLTRPSAIATSSANVTTSHSAMSNADVGYSMTTVRTTTETRETPVKPHTVEYTQPALVETVRTAVAHDDPDYDDPDSPTKTTSTTTRTLVTKTTTTTYSDETGAPVAKERHEAPIETVLVKHEDLEHTPIKFKPVPPPKPASPVKSPVKSAMDEFDERIREEYEKRKSHVDDDPWKEVSIVTHEASQSKENEPSDDFDESRETRTTVATTTTTTTKTRRVMMTTPDEMADIRRERGDTPELSEIEKRRSYLCTTTEMERGRSPATLNRTLTDQSPVPSPMLRYEAQSPNGSVKTPEPSSVPNCACCSHPIRGKCVTALGPNSEFAQKFHPECFVCTYCTRALNTRGTYKENEKKPYCHECFYRLYSGLIYAFDDQNRVL